MSDELYAKALYHVTNDRKAATSYIQRRLQIGYNTAAGLIERMEAEGHVGPANHVGKREILTGPTDEPAPITEQTTLAEKQPVDDGPPWKEEDTVASGPVRTFICSGCDTETESAGDLPRGWYRQPSASLGMMLRCPECAKKNATKIATSTKSTEEILNWKEGDGDEAISSAAQSRLKTIIERAQKVLEDIVGLRGDLKEVFDEAKGEGFDVKAIRKLMSEMQKDPAKREEEQTILELYAAAIGFNL